jgi:hypothetical protein
MTKERTALNEKKRSVTLVKALKTEDVSHNCTQNFTFYHTENKNRLRNG